MPAASAPTVSAPATESALERARKLTHRTVRASKVTLDLSTAAPAAAYDGAIVAAGTRPVGDAREDVLAVKVGDTITAFPQSAIIVAIMYGVLPADILADALEARNEIAGA